MIDEKEKGNAEDNEDIIVELMAKANTLAHLAKRDTVFSSDLTLVQVLESK